MVAILVAMVGQLGVSGDLPVAAYDDCQWVGGGNGTNGSDWTCTYTQLGGSNYDWPDKGAGTYPKCSDNNGNYCQWWPSPNGYYDQVPYANNLANDSRANFKDDADTAVNDWSGQPYNSPYFYDCHRNNTCGNVSLVIEWYDLGPFQAGKLSTCADEGFTSVSGDTAVVATIRLNTEASWSPGYNRSGFCDVASTLYHEVGHAFTEGHSSNPNDVMAWRDCMCTTIDGDAKALLSGVYGPPGGNNGGNGGCGCGFTFSICGLPGNPCSALPGIYTEGYLEKAWYASKVVTTPNSNILSIITPSVCVPAETSYDTWAECMVDASLAARHIPPILP